MSYLNENYENKKIFISIQLTKKLNELEFENFPRSCVIDPFLSYIKSIKDYKISGYLSARWIPC